MSTLWPSKFGHMLSNHTAIIWIEEIPMMCMDHKLSSPPWPMLIKAISPIQIIYLWLLSIIICPNLEGHRVKYTWVMTSESGLSRVDFCTCYLGMMLAIPNLSIPLESSSRELQFGTKIKHRDSSKMKLCKICKNTKLFLTLVPNQQLATTYT